MTNTNLAEKLTETTIGTPQELGMDKLEQSIKDVAKEIEAKYIEIKKLQAANDNTEIDPNNPDDPNQMNLLNDFNNIDEKVKSCLSTIKEKGLSPEEYEKKFNETFTVAENYLRYELEISNVFKSLPTMKGFRSDLTDDENQPYTKKQYIETVYGIPYKTAWRISKLTEKNVNDTISYARAAKMLPTTGLVLRLEKYYSESSITGQNSNPQKSPPKVKKKSDSDKIQQGINNFNAIHNLAPLSDPDATYNIIYADPSVTKYTLDELKQYHIPASENSILFLWTPVSKLKEMLELLDAWGFSYSESAVWDRMDQSHPGTYFKNQHDILLVGAKGNGLKPLSREKSICRLKLKDGEIKPNYYTEILKIMFPGQNYFDLFANPTVVTDVE